MSDTIEWLEAIGQDAGLRHASTEELGQILEQAQASAILRAAAASGDRSRLAEEFGQKPMHPPQISQAPGHDDEEPEHEEDPRQPPSPDRDQPSPQS